MNLDDTQKQTVTRWINEGAKLSEIQSRLASEFNLRLTYMEVRMLVDDLKLTPKDPEPAKPAKPLTPNRSSAPDGLGSPAQPDSDFGPDDTEGDLPPTPTTGVKVSVDRVNRPGSVVSGQVTFTDGKSAQWSLDQLGRLGLAPQQKGYKPSDLDLQAFQVQLQHELQKMGF